MKRITLQLFGVFVLALILRLALFAMWHTDDWRNFESGDYILYYVGAEHFGATGDFTNSLFLVRPPLFSLVVYALQRDNNLVLLFNIALGSLTASLSCLLALQLGLSTKYAVLAGAIVAVDPTSIVYSTFLGAEPLANLLLLVSVILLLKALIFHQGTASLLWSAAAAIALVLSSLARPATYLLWIILSIWALFIDRKKWPVVATFAAICLLGVGAWSLHNGAIFGNRTFSTVGPFTMLYYRAASVERIALGETSENIDAVFTVINQRVEERLGHDISRVDAGTRHSYLAASPEVEKALQDVALEIFLKNPLIYIATIPLGFGRLYGLLPFASNLLPHISNNWLSIGIQMLWNSLFFLGGLMGLWFAYRRRQWLFLGCILIIGVYYTSGTLLVKSAGLNTRERSMLTPFMAIAFVYGGQILLEKWQQRNTT